MSHEVDIGRAEGSSGPSMFSQNTTIQKTEETNFIHSSRNMLYNKFVFHITTGARERGEVLRTWALRTRHSVVPDPIDTLKSTISAVLKETSRNQTHHRDEVEETTGIGSSFAPPQPITEIRQNQPQPPVEEATSIGGGSARPQANQNQEQAKVRDTTRNCPLPQAMPTDHTSEHDSVNVNSIRSSDVLPITEDRRRKIYTLHAGVSSRLSTLCSAAI